MATKIDDNYGTVALAVDENGVIVPLKVDPVTGYLLAIAVVGTGADLDVEIMIDENCEGVAMGVDDTTGDVKPLKVAPISGALLCKA